MQQPTLGLMNSESRRRVGSLRAVAGHENFRADDLQAIEADNGDLRG